MRIEFGILCEIYHFDEDGFEVGFIINKIGNMILVENYDPNGMYDGFCLQSINVISKIRYTSKYLNFMDKLIIKHANDQIFESITSIINYAFQHSKLISLSLKRWKYVKNFSLIQVNNNEMIVKKIDYLGVSEKSIIINITDVNYIEVDSLELKKYETYLANLK